MRSTVLFVCLLIATSAFAQSGGDFAELPDGKVPANVIIVKGAEPSASDRSTALPEDGRVSHNVYRSRYLGLTYPLPADWAESYQGPPPSDTGQYVLTQLVPGSAFQGAKGTVLVTAQDMFFARGRGHDAAEMVSYGRAHLPSYYELEREPSTMKIAARTFVRYDYMSRAAGIHWYVLATDVRCHAVQFVFMGQDTKMLESLIADLNRAELTSSSDEPVCKLDYARTAIYKVDPVFEVHHFNAIPVRFIVDKKGNVRHVHVISALPDQAARITDALMQWKFNPAETEIESGVLFGGTNLDPNGNVD
jgi:hypothetical protein